MSAYTYVQLARDSTTAACSIDLFDTTYATSISDAPSTITYAWDLQNSASAVQSVPYATAAGCAGAAGFARVDLSSTAVTVDTTLFASAT